MAIIYNTASVIAKVQDGIYSEKLDFLVQCDGGNTLSARSDICAIPPLTCSQAL